MIPAYQLTHITHGAVVETDGYARINHDIQRKAATYLRRNAV
jgi:hypothetical protein